MLAQLRNLPKRAADVILFSLLVLSLLIGAIMVVQYGTSPLSSIAWLFWLELGFYSVFFVCFGVFAAVGPFAPRAWKLRDRVYVLAAAALVFLVLLPTLLAGRLTGGNVLVAISVLAAVIFNLHYWYAHRQS